MTTDNPADPATPTPGDTSPGVGEAARHLHQAGRESWESVSDMRRAFARLVSADITLARLALARAAVWMGIAVAFGASGWLLLMAALITGLHALGLSWVGATAISAGVSLAITALAGWRALRFFQMGRFEATRRHLSALSPQTDEDEEDEREPTLPQVQRRIARADQLLTGRAAQLTQHLGQVKTTWAAAWTPLRILGAGLGLGFVSGKLEPGKAAGGLAARLGAAPRILQTLTALSGLLAATKARETVDEAMAAANAADDAVANTHAAASPYDP